MIGSIHESRTFQTVYTVRSAADGRKKVTEDQASLTSGRYSDYGEMWSRGYTRWDSSFVCSDLRGGLH